MHSPRPGPSLAAISNLALITHVAPLASSPSSSQPDPHLDTLLALTLECTLEPAPPPSIEQWPHQPPAAPLDDDVLDIIDQLVQTTADVRAKGMDDALLWVGDAVRALVALPEEDEFNLSANPPPPPLLRASPLGLYVRRTALSFAKLDFAETLEWWAAFEQWCDGVEPAHERKKRRDVPGFARARLQQDYQAAREHVRTFVPAGQRDSTAQQALLHLALIEFEDGGFEAAQLALDEATSVARTIGDAPCLAACTSLRLRLEAASSNSPSRKKARAALTSPHDLLWDISQRSSSDTPLSTLFPQLYLARAASQQLAFPVPPAAPLKTDPAHGGKMSAPSAPRAVDHPGFASAWHVVAAGLWDAMGIAPLARLHDSLALALDDARAPSWDVRLTVLERRAARLVDEGRDKAARRVLLRAVEGREERKGMGAREVGRWRGLVERVGEGAARRTAGSAGHDEDDEPPYARLTRAATTAHLSSLAQREPSRLSALITLVGERQRAGGPGAAERGLAELEEAWAAALALDEGNGAVEEDGERRLRAREARVLGLVGAQGEGAPIEELLVELEQVAQRYLALSLPLDAQRVLLTAAKLADHLAASSTAPSPWMARRDALAQQWLALERGDDVHAVDAAERERAERVGRVVGLVERAVEVANR
ncbi:hypothetical protein JCM8208_004865 [Rhodotorula glutinis]